MSKNLNGVGPMDLKLLATSMLEDKLDHILVLEDARRFFATRHGEGFVTGQYVPTNPLSAILSAPNSTIIFAKGNLAKYFLSRSNQHKQYKDFQDVYAKKASE